MHHDADTLVLDSLSIVPGSILASQNDIALPDSIFETDWVKGTMWMKPEFRENRPVHIVVTYRVFPISFSQVYKNKDVSLINQSGTVSKNPFAYTPGKDYTIIKYEGLSRSGSISRGVTFGNNQDVFVNSSLNLQMAGKISEDIEILAAITDENIPVQPEGNTQQIQEFDKVFIQLSNESSKLIAGDFELRKPDGYFMSFYKKSQGAIFTSTFNVTEKGKDNESRNPMKNKIGVSASVSKGKYARNTLAVNEGNQGPYRLSGANNESFIIVLAGTEKVFIDGIPLERGFEHDYIIDYNTAEIIFTAKQIIRKESRIVIEFEYSEKSYVRSTLFLSEEVSGNNFSVRFNAFSEQDSKNQPLQADLDSAQKAFLASIGDSVSLAYYPTGQQVPFNEDLVLYEKKDTTTSNGLYNGIYLYSTNKDSVLYQVTFTNVGNGNGDYIQEISSTNGRVFKWVEPQGGLKQGNFAPVALLSAPKKQQLFTLGGEWNPHKNWSSGMELALSNYDVNLFSNLNQADNTGYALRSFLENTSRLSSDTLNGLKLKSGFSYEFVGLNFKPIERFRPVEFERDWNLGTVVAKEDEHWGTASIALIKRTLGRAEYKIRFFQKGAAYNGLMHLASIVTSVKGFDITGNGSSLNTTGATAKTAYLKHNAEIKKTLGKFTLLLKELTERNEITSSGSDTLSALSFFFNEFLPEIRFKDTAGFSMSLNYKKRYDLVPEKNSFLLSTEVDEFSVTGDLSRSQKHQFRIQSSYRALTDKMVNTTDRSTRTFLGRLDDRLVMLKGVITASTLYEASTGQERKLEYYFLEVPAGQGAFIYRGDSNGNGVKDLDEFEQAAFQNEANYVKIFTPTSEFISTRTNLLNEVISINPGAAMRGKAGSKNLVSRFSNLLSVRLDKKTRNENVFSSLNPFDQKVEDSAVVAVNSSYRNTLYFNRSSVKFGADATWQKNNSKSLLTTGFETRLLTSTEWNARWNISRLLLLTLNYKYTDKLNASDFFASRNYQLISHEAEPKLSLQPNSTVRLSMYYRKSEKKNIIGLLGEKATSNKLGTEFKVASEKTGNIQLRFNYIKIQFNSSENSPIGYDMLEGLKNGSNYTWNASAQRNLGSSIQLSLTYDGRKSEESKTIHTGGMQVRAFF